MWDLFGDKYIKEYVNESGSLLMILFERMARNSYLTFAYISIVSVYIYLFRRQRNYIKAKIIKSIMYYIFSDNDKTIIYLLWRALAMDFLFYEADLMVLLKIR